MGLGSATPRKETYYLRFKTQKEINGTKITQPHFVVTRYDVNGNKSDMPDEVSVSGYLCAISTTQREWPKGTGDMYDILNLKLIDNGIVFVVQVGADSQIGRNLMNTIAGTKHFDVIKLTVRLKDEFPAIYVRNNDAQCEWRFDPKTELNPLIEVVPDPKKPNKTVKVYHKMNTKLMEAWQETIPIVAAYAQKMGYSNQLQTTTAHLDNSTRQDIDNLNQKDLENNSEREFAPPSNDEPFFPPDNGLDDMPF